MPELNFQIGGVSVVPYAAVPTLAFHLQVENAVPQEAIHTVALRCQIQIEATRRRYAPEEQHGLLDLFGDPGRWSRTLRSMLWTHANVVIPAFTGPTATADLHVPCSFDFNIAATKYFAALAEGDIPLNFLFSGTVFYAPPEGGGLQVAPIAWDREARCKVPVSVWRALMEAYYPNTAWLNLRRDVFERLYRYKVQKGIPTWEQVFEEILPAEIEPVKV
jgi:hypothetical protein